ncbi:hypothetical protein [Methylobacterium sp. CM6246]
MKRTVRVRAGLWPVMVVRSFYLPINGRYALAGAAIVHARMRRKEHLVKIVLSV